MSINISIYYASISKIADMITNEIKNSILSEDYTSVRNSTLKLVPTIFEQIKIVKNNKAVFLISNSQTIFFLEISRLITPSEKIIIGPAISNVIYRVNILPQIIISILLSLVAALLTLPFIILEHRKLELIKQNYIFSFSKKLAHDIRSPLSTLNLISSKIEREDIKSLQLAVIDQINNIANNLLIDSKKTNILNYSDLFMQLKSEYKIKSSHSKRKILFKIDRKLITLSLIAHNFLYATINNLIQNAIDATPENGFIKVTASFKENFIEILISDNGVGIPSNIIKNLGKHELTYGKVNGNGIGLFNAFQNIQSISGIIKINSTVNIGTTISLQIPV
ncbi:MAG: sensor histidine kinase [Pseudobdellovibrio sp.]